MNKVLTAVACLLMSAATNAEPAVAHQYCMCTPATTVVFNTKQKSAIRIIAMGRHVYRLREPVLNKPPVDQGYVIE